MGAENTFNKLLIYPLESLDIKIGSCCIKSNNLDSPFEITKGEFLLARASSLNL